jgi:hypothetical protein
MAGTGISYGQDVESIADLRWRNVFYFLLHLFEGRVSL